MKKLYVLVTVLLLHFSGFGQVINFPDANFKAKLLTASATAQVASTDANGGGYLAIDTNANGEIEVSEALLIKWLNVSAATISSLEGIEGFTNLRNLNCKNNGLTTLNVNGLSFLTTIDCSDNQLSTINDAQIPATVRTLRCQNNLLTNLSLNHLTNLATLNCSHNQLITLNVEQINNKFVYLDCSFNNLTALSVPNFFPFQDMGSQSMFLNCAYNQLSQISFNMSAGREELSFLDLSHNNFTDLTLSSMSISGSVLVSDNPLNNLTFSNFDMGGQDPDDTVTLFVENTNLSQLTVPGGYSLYLSIKDNPNLISLDMKNNAENIHGYWYYDEVTEEDYYVYSGVVLENNPLLATICCDEYELDYLSSLVPGAQVSEYCNFTPGGNYNTISGSVTFNCPDGIGVASNIRVNINSIYAASFADGANTYSAFTGYGSQNVTLNLQNPDYFTVTPSSYALNFPSLGIAQTANFCIAPNGTHRDLEIVLLPVTPARPGFDALYEIVCKNNGNQTESGTATLNFNEATLDFISANPVINTQSSGSLTWDFSNMAPFETRKIRCTFNVNSPQETPAVNIDDVLPFNATIASAGTEETPNDNTFNMNQTVVGSYDPNDKIVTEGSSIDISRIGDYLHFMIRFQNTGTAAAQNVVVKDLMPTVTRIDWNSLQMIGASHPYRCTSVYGKLEFVFEGINLPASNVNESGSHGYVAFKVKPSPTIVVGDAVVNNALIYFDFNFPIATNSTTTMVTTLGRKDFNSKETFVLYPNPVRNRFNIDISKPAHVKSIGIYNTLGQLVQSVPESNFGKTTSIDAANLKSGTYFIEIISDRGKSTQKIIKR